MPVRHPTRQSGEAYQLRGGQDTAMVQELNALFARLTSRLDQMEGRNGTPKLYAHLDMNGQRLKNLANPTDINSQDAAPMSQALTLAAHGAYDAQGVTIIGVPRATENTHAVPYEQLTGLIADTTTVTAANFVTLATIQTITGQKTFSTGGGNQPFTVTGGVSKVVNLDSDKWDGKDYTTSTWTATGTGFTASITGTARYVLAGEAVVLFLPSLTGTSNAVSFTITGMPASLQPTQTSWQVIRITDNGADAVGLLRLNAGSTTIDLFATTGAGAWTALGTKTLYPTVITYPLL